MAAYGKKIVCSSDGMEVKARRQLDSEGAFNTFMDDFMAKLGEKQDTGADIVVSDLDLSQNKLSLEQWSTVLAALSAANARVVRFRLFGCATLDDEVMKLLADYFKELTAKQAPLEMHLSDCAITTVGFDAFMDALQQVDYYPVVSTAGKQPSTLYLRLENNYIDPAAIQARVDSGLINSFTKKESRWTVKEGSKVNLLVTDHGQFQQKQGAPPAPENAPPPKQVNDHNSSYHGSTGGKGASWPANGCAAWANSGIQRSAQWNAVPAAMATWNSNAWQGGTTWQAAASAQGGKGVQNNMMNNPWQAAQNSWAQPAQGAWAGKGQTANAFGSAAAVNAAKSAMLFGNRGAAAGNFGSSVDRSRTPVGAAARAAGPGVGMPGQGSTNVKPLPHPWEEHWSEEYKIPYFWNPETGDSVWHRPEA